MGISPNDLDRGARARWRQLQFAEIHGAEVRRSGVRLGEVVRPIQQATKPDAVLDAEHMTRLVGQNFATAPEHQLARARGMSHGTPNGAAHPED